VYKLIGILKRPEGVSVEAFQRWWLQEHATFVKQFPGLRKYAINLTITGDQRYDGVAEVWFDSREDMERVFSTREGQAARQSATSHSAEIAILFTEEHVIVKGENDMTAARS
jgi:uncharacterized protein (TIGR02118 family)